MQRTYNYKSYHNNRNLIVGPVQYGVYAGGGCRKDSTGITRAPVEAQGGGNCCRSGKAAYAEADKNREHGYH